MELEINIPELHKMYDGCTESITEVFDAFLGAQHEMLDEINIAFENENENLIRQQLHYHAPVFGYIGFPQLTLFLKSLEDKYQQKNTLHEMRQDHAAIVNIIIKVTELLIKEKEKMRKAAHV